MLSDAERAAFNFELPEMVQKTFYAMLLNDAVELDIVSSFMAGDLKLTLEGLRWMCFKSWLCRSSCDLLEVQLRQRTPPGGVCGQQTARKRAQDKLTGSPHPVMRSDIRFFSNIFLYYAFFLNIPL